MPRPFRSYDYGLRGFRETAPQRMRGGYETRGLGMGYDERSRPRTNRVTARYNDDYVYGARGQRYDRNYNMYTGDRMQRMGDERMYRHPYLTIGGTRTQRGSSFPTGYDYPDYGPNYGGRYPDEL